MYTIITTNRFEKELKLCKKRGYNMELIQKVISILSNTGKLPEKYKPHKLSGNYENCWECHIKGDWLLIWMQNDQELTLLFTNTGTHSDLF
ncbi:type II toxin-antitoxin system YafQ family toxin [Flavobacterium sp.]|jgi:mRNA interferase YafQ|uniref:type II toxin-antitoxin system YafQ family toxin n=1 Tax=Flavobacterium sp. TaxID=239 RepID=UPI0033423CD8